MGRCPRSFSYYTWIQLPNVCLYEVSVFREDGAFHFARDCEILELCS